MQITIKQIAELAGVSRGTVDRVLNDRGNVKGEIQERVTLIAKQLGYRPNKAGKNLAARKNPIKIGVVIFSSSKVNNGSGCCASPTRPQMSMVRSVDGWFY